MDADKTASVHRAKAAQTMSPIGRRLFKFIEFDPDEELIAEIRKHPIGYIAIGVVGSLIAIIVFLAAAVLAANLDKLNPNTVDGVSTALKTIIIAGGTALTALILVVTIIGIILYRLNVIYVTNEKIAEVAYISLFNRKITQLGLGQVEDVTDRKRGIFAYIFNYGTLIVETAGERENATFSTVPNPNYYSQKIIQAHEQNIREHGN